MHEQTVLITFLARYRDRTITAPLEYFMTTVFGRSYRP